MSVNNQQKSRFFKSALMVAMLIIGVFIGKFFNNSPEKAIPHDSTAHQDMQPKMYTCSMHPSVRLPDPDALCPICGMTLIEVSSDLSEAPGELTLSESAVKLAEIETTVVTKSLPHRTVRLQGQLGYDETANSQISAWVSGRIDKLYADYTGMAVRKGDHMARLYSPELLSAQTELLEAKKATDSITGDTGEILTAALNSNYTLAAEKLKLLGLTSEQIGQIEQNATADAFITISTPISGIVTQRHAEEGQYVQTGSRIYSVADLKHLWLMLDAYESDMPWIRVGNKCEFTLPAVPGRVFEGVISFVSPTLDAKTRTASIRVNVDNTDGTLRPAMLAIARISAQLDQSGKAISNIDYSNKYICPMHPSVVQSQPGKCPICEMDTEPAESLGYVHGGSHSGQIIQIPESAVLNTGTRSVVYVKKSNTEKPVFTLRTITLGPASDGTYTVLSGLSEGEIIVTRGAFKIDSERQLQNKPTMMSQLPMQSDMHAMHEGHSQSMPDNFSDKLENVIDSYIKLSQSLSSDDLAGAKSAAGQTLDNSNALAEILSTSDNAVMTNAVAGLRKFSASAARSENINTARESFSTLSQNLQAIIEAAGNTTGKTYYLARCPMAFDNTGATWISDFDGILNPYFGSAMLKCGTILQSYAPEAANTNGGSQSDE